MEHVNEGSRLYQEVKKEYQLPDSVDASKLRSQISGDGILSLEAPLKDSVQPKEVPIQREDDSKSPTHPNTQG